MKLAIETGRPTFDPSRHVGWPRVEAETRRSFHELIDQAFDHNWLTNDGPLVRKLEKEVAKIHGVENCIAVANGTLALLLTLQALKLEGEVILPAFTFIATAHACLWQRLEPVFVDISNESLMLDPEQVAALITPRTSAIIGVHLFGDVCDVSALSRISRKYGLKLVFDAAHAFGCRLNGQPIGGFGDAEVLSFHATKIFNTFEGGAILTRDAVLAHRLSLLRNFGFRGYDDVISLGLNAKMCEASAAMGLASLPVLGTRLDLAREINRAYSQGLGDVPGLHFLTTSSAVRTNYHYAVLRINHDKFGISRDVLNKVCWAEGLLTRRYFYPGCHLMEPYRTMLQDRPPHLPVTEAVSREVICLPTHLPGGLEDVEKIIEIIKTVHNQADKVKKWAADYL